MQRRLTSQTLTKTFYISSVTGKLASEIQKLAEKVILQVHSENPSNINFNYRKIKLDLRLFCELEKITYFSRWSKSFSLKSLSKILLTTKKTPTAWLFSATDLFWIQRTEMILSNNLWNQNLAAEFRKYPKQSYSK